MSRPLAAGESVFADISEPMLSKPMSSRAKEGTNNNSMGKRNGAGRSNTHPADGLKHINLRGASAGPTGARSAMNFRTIARSPARTIRVTAEAHGAMWSQPGFIPLALITVMADGLIK